MRLINRVTTLLLAACTLVAAQQTTSSSLQVFKFWGEGNGTSGGAGGNLQGTGQTNLAGVAGFSVSFTNGQLLGQNGSGTGTCSLEDGTLELVTSSGTITMRQVGTSCNVSSGPAPNTLNATYLVTQGTGRFKGATGTGTLVVGFSSATGPATGLILMDGLLK